MDLGLLTWNTGADQSLGVLGDSLPDELFLQEGRCCSSEGVCQAVDEVEDVLTKLKRGPWARATGADVAEEGVAVVVERDIFPPRAVREVLHKGISGSCPCRRARSS